jgi:hypothetical protein
MTIESELRAAYDALTSLQEKANEDLATIRALRRELAQEREIFADETRRLRVECLEAAARARGRRRWRSRSA